jgi:D-inositol-3-phosphate glycosyltransferase
VAIPYASVNPIMSTTLLAVSSNKTGTGFARVITEVLGTLRSEFRLVQLSIGSGQIQSEWECYISDDSTDVWGVRAFREVLAKVKPDIVLIYHDLWFVPSYAVVAKQVRPDCRIIAYVPLEGRLKHPEIVETLNDVDSVVVFTSFAKQEIEANFKKRMEQNAAVRVPNIHIVPHGVDTAKFHPVGSCELGEHHVEAKQLYYGGLQDQHGFIVLNANRNQPRKRIDITLKAFALFACNKPSNVKLHLHMAMKNSFFQVLDEARRYGIADRLIYSADDLENHPTLKDHSLNLLYNACDVGINTSEGEGWGLVSFEHGATCAAQIVPNHSSLSELWKDHGLLVNTAPGPDRLFFKTMEADPAHAARLLNELYDNRGFLNRMSLKAYRTSTHPRLRWNSIGQLWRNILELR